MSCVLCFITSYLHLRTSMLPSNTVPPPPPPPPPPPSLARDKSLGVALPGLIVPAKDRQDTLSENIYAGKVQALVTWLGTDRFTDVEVNNKSSIYHALPGLVAHYRSMHLIGDTSLDDVDPPVLKSTVSNDGEYKLHVVEAWQQIVSRLISSTSTWEHVVSIIRSNAASKHKRSRLIAARNKANMLAELMNKLHPELASRQSETDDVTTTEASRDILTTRPADLLEIGYGEIDVVSSYTESAEEEGGEYQHIAPTYKQLKKLMRVLNEFLSTERTYVNDVLRLQTFFNELLYSTLNPIITFVSSPSYQSIKTSISYIYNIHSLMLHALENAFEEANHEFGQHDDIHCFESVLNICCKTLKLLQQYIPYFPLFSQYIIQHNSVSSLYRDLCADAQFQVYITQCEDAIGENFASLLIKSVQRLPRYILLCREVYLTIHAAAKDCKEEEHAILRPFEEHAKVVLDAMSDAGVQCNTEVRVHQDTLRMHELHKLFQEGGTDLQTHTLVRKGRRVIKEGSLKRQHKHSGIRPHEFHVFSDILICSTNVGKGLLLEYTMDIGHKSDAICLPIPNFGPQCTDNWFLVAQNDKTLYACAMDENDRNRWVQAIVECLEANESDTDMFHMKKQVALVNMIIDEINKNIEMQHTETLLRDIPGVEGMTMITQRLSLRPNQLIVDMTVVEEDVTPRDTTEDSDAECEYTEVPIQVCWWKLLDAIENTEDASTPFAHLNRVMEEHSNEVRKTILNCFNQDDKRGKQHVASLIFNDNPHWYIASGWFFDRVNNGVLELGERPRLIRLFLLSDVLIGGIAERGTRPLNHLFTIKLCNLDISDHRENSGDCAMLLTDTAAKKGMRRFSLTEMFVENKPNILFAPTMALKFDWMALMMDAINAAKAGNARPFGISEKKILRRRVSNKRTAGAWMSESSTKTK